MSSICKERLICICNIGDPGIYLLTNAPDDVIAEQLRIIGVKECSGINIVNEYDYIEEQGYVVCDGEHISRKEKDSALLFYQEDYHPGFPYLRIVRLFSNLTGKEEILATNAPDSIIKVNMAYINALTERGELIERPYAVIEDAQYVAVALDYSDNIMKDFRSAVEAEFDYSRLTDKECPHSAEDLVDNSSVFLVQRKLDDGTTTGSLMQSQELCDYICMDDCHNEEYTIWDITHYGEVYQCHYVGWQPGCLIEVRRDFDQKIVLSLYGEDH